MNFNVYHVGVTASHGYATELAQLISLLVLKKSLLLSHLFAHSGQELIRHRN